MNFQQFPFLGESVTKEVISMRNPYTYLLNQNLGTGTQFEDEVKFLLLSNGFTASGTGNDDHGIDIIAQAPTEGNPVFYIQCKYQNSSINSKPIQEVFTGAALRKNKGHPVVFTASHITEGAREEAEQLGVEIIARPELTRLELLTNGQMVAGGKPKGLAGILYGIARDRGYANACSSALTSTIPQQPQADPKVKPSDSKIEMKKRVIEERYREIARHEQQLSELLFQESEHRKTIQKLQKEALLQALDGL